MLFTGKNHFQHYRYLPVSIKKNRISFKIKNAGSANHRQFSYMA